ncbi:uncharacterized protein LOC133111084 [Conger conger]|uniref:uncharacterized protein LOC133111084 n=1 Tax=Conger conger TaxID=82655 RepID=UPI002A5AF42C|nr:uncharacterized protein LOC133111084 [Conger conger]
MAAVAQIQLLTLLLLAGLHHFGQPCDVPFVERVVFSRTGQEILSLPLPDNISSEVSTVLWTRKKHVVARIRLHNITVSGNMTNIFTNGALQVHNLTKYDHGAYKAEGHNDAGNCIFREHIWLEVRDPVSRPTLSLVSCILGRVDLRCEVEGGDNVSFRWAMLGPGLNTSLGEGALLSVGGADQRKFICVASNEASTETSDPLKLDCPGVNGGLSDEFPPYQDSTETEDIEGCKNYANFLLLLLWVCGVLLAVLCAILCAILSITNKVREGPKIAFQPGELNASPVHTEVFYTQIPIMDRDRGDPGEG